MVTRAVVVVAVVVAGSGNLERRESYANSTHARPSKKGFARVDLWRESLARYKSTKRRFCAAQWPRSSPTRKLFPTRSSA